MCDYPDPSDVRSGVVYAYGDMEGTLEVDSGWPLPDPSDVREGVMYGPDYRIGTCAVPSPSQVAYGVPVDHTTGTAILTMQNILTAFQTPINPSFNIPSLVTMLNNLGVAVQPTSIATAMAYAPTTNSRQENSVLWHLEQLYALADNRLRPSYLADILNAQVQGPIQANTAMARLQAIQNALGELNALPQAIAGLLEDMLGELEIPEELGNQLQMIALAVNAIQNIVSRINVNSVTVAPTLHAGYLRLLAQSDLRAEFRIADMPQDWRRIWFTAKTSPILTDERALLQVRLSNPSTSGDGLCYLDGKIPEELNLPSNTASLHLISAPES